jgi:hypothetical protein
MFNRCSIFTSHAPWHFLSFNNFSKPLIINISEKDEYSLIKSKVSHNYTLGPLEPGVRWERDQPCDAGWPLKPQRFITPQKPFPMLMSKNINNTARSYKKIHIYVIARQSTYWPGTKCKACNVVPWVNKKDKKMQDQNYKITSKAQIF